ncbi:hypothetical protein N5P32_05235 [Marinomonas pontica]|uniref:hypothetical protein n=1 Tax=Marinomonas pontica TaxID=264739 RepID=UPI00224323ED|nr:hypothetical protein [Marinomonas pontica]MCW8355322.1 hypothetical protein [Marinomonas pontica]
MASVEQSISFVEIINAIGPYVVAVAGMAFGYFQSKKVAEITKEKDLQIASIQQDSILAMEQFKKSNVALLKLQEIYSPMFAKVESLFHTYRGLVSDKKSSSAIQADLEKFLVDDYISFSVESRKAVLAEAIVICQVLQDHKAYEIAANLDNKITEALSLIDFTGKSSGSEHMVVLKKLQREYRLLYVSLFHRVSNLNSAANNSSNADAASCTGS